MRRVSHPQTIYLGLLERSLETGHVWLDLGCGRRVMMPWIARVDELGLALSARARIAVGVDLDLSALQDNQTLQYRVLADSSRLTFAAASFNLVSSNMVFEHLDKPRETIDEIYRVLRPGGRLLIHTPNVFDIVSIVACLVPNRWHPYLVARFERRTEADVYPTRYRMNDRRTVRNYLSHAGFSHTRVTLIESPEVYSHVPVFGAIEWLWHFLARRLEFLRGSMIVEARK